ncbi:unnamed protein product, partial [Rangifer tarandus platyrhynchus]
PGRGRPPALLPFPSSRRPRWRLRGSGPAGTSAERPPAARPGEGGSERERAVRKARAPPHPGPGPGCGPDRQRPARLGTGRARAPTMCQFRRPRGGPGPEPPPPRPLPRPAGLGPAPPGGRELRDGGSVAGAAPRPGPSLHFAQTCFSKVGTAGRLHRPLKVDWGSCGRPPLTSGLWPRPVPASLPGRLEAAQERGEWRRGKSAFRPSSEALSPDPRAKAPLGVGEGQKGPYPLRSGPR